MSQVTTIRLLQGNRGAVLVLAKVETGRNYTPKECLGCGCDVPDRYVLRAKEEQRGEVKDVAEVIHAFFDFPFTVEEAVSLCHAHGNDCSNQKQVARPSFILGIEP
jgi:hypothetical protein